MTQARHEAGDHPVETLYEGQWLRMKRRGHWEYAERSHGNGMAVIIIAATPDDHVLFVEQYRVPLGKRTIEMPAGLVGDDHAHDTLESAARRELIEETYPDEFKHFIGQDIRLDPVMLDKATSIETLLEFYMGKNTPDRQEFIINNLKVELDVVE